MRVRTQQAVASLGSFAVRRVSHSRLPMFAQKWKQYFVVQSLRTFCKRPVYYGTRVNTARTRQGTSSSIYLDKHRSIYDSDYWYDSPTH